MISFLFPDFSRQLLSDYSSLLPNAAVLISGACSSTRQVCLLYQRGSSTCTFQLNYSVNSTLLCLLSTVSKFLYDIEQLKQCFESSFVYCSCLLFLWELRQQLLLQDMSDSLHLERTKRPRLYQESRYELCENRLWTWRIAEKPWLTYISRVRRVESRVLQLKIRQPQMQTNPPRKFVMLPKTITITKLTREVPLL